MQTWQEGVVLPVRLLYTHGHTTYFDWNVLAQVPMYASHVARTCPYFRLGGSAEPGRSPLNKQRFHTVLPKWTRTRPTEGPSTQR